MKMLFERLNEDQANRVVKIYRTRTRPKGLCLRICIFYSISGRMKKCPEMYSVMLRSPRVRVYLQLPNGGVWRTRKNRWGVCSFFGVLQGFFFMFCFYSRILSRLVVTSYGTKRKEKCMKKARGIRVFLYFIIRVGRWWTNQKKRRSHIPNFK